MSASRGHADGPRDGCSSRSRQEQLDLGFRASSLPSAGCGVRSKWVKQSRGCLGLVFQMLEPVLPARLGDTKQSPVWPAPTRGTRLLGLNEPGRRRCWQLGAAAWSKPCFAAGPPQHCQGGGVLHTCTLSSLHWAPPAPFPAAASPSTTRRGQGGDRGRGHIHPPGKLLIHGAARLPGPRQGLGALV